MRSFVTSPINSFMCVSVLLSSPSLFYHLKDIVVLIENKKRMNLVEVFVHKSTMEIITDGIIDKALLGLIQCSLIMKHRFFCPTISIE